MSPKSPLLPLNTQDAPPAGLKYQPQLSGLRICGVFFVMIYHYSTHLMGLRPWYDLGSFIIFYFVLSSYLITRILLNARDKALTSGMARSKVAAVFLFRRTLRIFPAYYLYLIFLILLPVAGAEAREYAGLHFFYLSNFQLYFAHAIGPYTFHFWTLSVEEQFYLTWPWFILFIPERRLPLFLGILIAIAVTFRVVMTSMMVNPYQELIAMLNLTPACLDSFAIGAWLAWMHHRKRPDMKILRRITLTILPFWIFLALSKMQTSIFTGIDRLFMTMLSALIIERANKGYKGIIKKFLENRVIQYLSKISYGIYIYHLIAPMLVTWLALTLQEHLGGFQWMVKMAANHRPAFILSFLMAVGCASISWFCLELPLNRLKNAYTYFLPKRIRAAHARAGEEHREQMANRTM